MRCSTYPILGQRKPLRAAGPRTLPISKRNMDWNSRMFLQDDSLQDGLLSDDPPPKRAHPDLYRMIAPHGGFLQDYLRTLRNKSVDAAKDMAKHPMRTYM